MPQVDELAAAEQAEVAVGRGQRIPFEAGFGNQDFAIVVSGRASGGAYLIAGFDRQQRLVAVHDIERALSPGPDVRQAGQDGPASV